MLRELFITDGVPGTAQSVEQGCNLFPSMARPMTWAERSRSTDARSPRYTSPSVPKNQQ